MGISLPIESEVTTHGMCRRCVERTRREGIDPRPEVVIVVQRAEQIEPLAAALADLPGVTVVRDRRTALRRQCASPVKKERRQLDRRRRFLSQRDPWLALGVQVMPVVPIRRSGSR
jgi:hypothetical protein